jgi:predicted nucleic acid-binding protein
MASKISAYVDTSALIAALDRSDSFHPVFRQLFSDPPNLVTSSLVVAEGQAWFLRRFDTTRSLQFLSFLEELPMIKVLSVGPEEIHDGRRVLQKFSDQVLTLVDGVGIALMKKHRIRRCWSTDRHLSLGGVPLVISSV